MTALWLALGSYLVAWPLLGRWTWAPLGLAIAMALLLHWPQRQTRPAGRQPWPADLEAMAGWLRRLAEMAGRRRLRLALAAELRDPAVLVGDELTLRQTEVRGPESWQCYMLAARAFAAAAQPRYRPLGLFGVGLGLGVAHALPSLLAVAWVLVLTALAGYAQLSGVDAHARAVERRTAELVGALRQECPEAFTELARRQGLLPPT